MPLESQYRTHQLDKHERVQHWQVTQRGADTNRIPTDPLSVGGLPRLREPQSQAHRTRGRRLGTLEDARPEGLSESKERLGHKVGGSQSSREETPLESGCREREGERTRREGVPGRRTAQVVKPRAGGRPSEAR